MLRSDLDPDSLALFPIQRISDLEKFFKQEFLNPSKEPNLALLSILIGALEESLTRSVATLGETLTAKKGPKRPPKQSKSLGRREISFEKTSKQPAGVKTSNGEFNTHGDSSQSSKDATLERDFPPLELELLEQLYNQFLAIIEKIDLSLFIPEDSHSDDESHSTSQPSRFTSHALLCYVSNMLWNRLSRSYSADRQHMQTLYTYLSGGRTNAFGFAYSVVAACQLLKLSDVHLALSEDHSWVVYGSEGKQSVEVTWHGKGIEDKRGSKPGSGDDANSWLYLKNNPVVCNRYTEVAAVVVAINPIINNVWDSLEMKLIQQKLLGLMHEMNLLQDYPMALDRLASLEEQKPCCKFSNDSTFKMPCERFYEQAIECARLKYDDMHVMPYIYYGNFQFRHHNYKAAFRYWADAAGVIRKYRYLKSDDAIYKEFLDISSVLLGTVMRESSAGISAHSVIRDPECFAQLLKFFDGICEWEEESKFPVVHIVWARSWATAINKFDCSIRKRVTIICGKPEHDGDGKENDAERGKSIEGKLEREVEDEGGVNIGSKPSSNKSNLTDLDGKRAGEEKLAIQALAKACTKILIPDAPVYNDPNRSHIETDVNQNLESKSEPCGDHSVASPSSASDSDSLGKCNAPSAAVTARPNASPDSGIHEDDLPYSEVTLHSTKMLGVKDLVLKFKFNVGDFILLLTAQSTAALPGGSGKNEDYKHEKRSRRSSPYDGSPAYKINKKLVAEKPLQKKLKYE